jgi:hypothetical protein
MQWSEQTMRALSAWLGPDTWYKQHAFDDGRFYTFVASVWRDEHRIWDESGARERICDVALRLHPDCAVLAAEVARTRVSQGTTILDFLSHMRRQQQLASL